MFEIYDGRAFFYQWDLNRKLIVEDSSIKEVHFCNRSEDCSLVCEVYTINGTNLVNVPNTLLQKCFAINVYAYDGESTKHSALFRVLPKSKPADYVYTETEVKNWEDYGKRISELEKEIANIDVTDSVAAYVEENIQHTKVYSYSTELGTKQTSVLHLPIVGYISNRITQDDKTILEAAVHINVAEMKPHSPNIDYLVTSPLLVEEDSREKLIVSNIKNVFDFGIMMGSKDNIYKFSDIISQFVDGTTFDNGTIEFSSSNLKNDSSSKVCQFRAALKIFSKYPAAISTLEEEFTAVLSRTTDYILYYNHNPINIIEGEYIGGN